MPARNRNGRRIQRLRTIPELHANVTTPPHPSRSPFLKKHGEENGYWEEISALCIEEESLRIQEKLLKQAVSNKLWVQEHFATIDNAVVVLLTAVENVNTLSYLVDMLRTV